jgi:hypothetical protein
MIGRYLAALSEGDPVAIGFTALFVVIAAGLGVFTWITKRRLDAEDERLKKRRGY